jgi:hypothetical protein
MYDDDECGGDDCAMDDPSPDYDPEFDCECGGDDEFAEPGGESALRAASPSNPRNLPCPTCGQPNRLTPKDADRNYQCDACARMDEGRGF